MTENITQKSLLASPLTNSRFREKDQDDAKKLLFNTNKETNKQIKWKQRVIKRMNEAKRK